MDRFVHSLVETSREAGYHVLLFAGTRTGKAEDELPAYDDLLRSTAVDAFVVTDTYLGNPQAAWLDERRAPFVAFGRPWDDPRRPAPLGRRRRRRRRRHRDHATCSSAATTGSPGSAGARTPASARTAAPAGAAPCASRDLPTTGLASRVEDTVASGREASAVLLDEAQPIGVRLRLRHPRHGRAAHARATAACAPASDIAVIGFDDSQVAQIVPPGLTSVRQPLEEVAVEVVKALEGLLGAPARRQPGVLLTPTLAVRGSS